jgi:gamma-glutamyltranspeptidase/glutathione hydrolase
MGCLRDPAEQPGDRRARHAEHSRGFPDRDYGRGTAETLHTLIEAKKLAYADMQSHVGDPRFSKVPIEAMLSKAYARERASLIDPRRAATNAAAGTLPMHGGDTT